MLDEGDFNYQLMSLALEIQNSLLEKEITEKNIFKEICSRLASFDPYHIVWIGITEPDGSMCIEAIEGSTATHLRKFNLNIDDVVDSAKLEACNLRHTDDNLVTGTNCITWKRFLTETKTASLLVQPLIIDTQCIGILCINSKLKDSFINELERSLLSFIARFLCLNLQNDTAAISQDCLLSQLNWTTTVFENISEGIIITDVGGKIINVNPALTKITGYPKDELIGKTPRVFQSGVHDKTFYSTMWAAILKTGSWSGEVWNKRKDGSIYPETLSITTVKDERNNKQNYIAVINDISNQKKTAEELQRLAFYDELTGLPNRSLFKENLNAAISNANRNNEIFALLFIDVDNFKLINDTLGHSYGDAMLKAMAKRLTNCVRETDVVARQGGDEFTVILHSLITSDDVIPVVNKILVSFESPIQVEEQKIFTSVSVGISFYPNDGDQPETLMKNADTAMYRAKDHGKNDYRVYTKCMNSHLHERMLIEYDLRHALERNELVLFYQPQIELSSGHIIGAEALLRWQHPERGIVSPELFIPIAEQSGLIIMIGEWVLKEACCQMKRWLNNGHQLNRIAVNLSARQFIQPDLVEVIMQTLSETELHPSYLELEITESCLVPSYERMAGSSNHCCHTQPIGKVEDVLQVLHKEGIQIAVDDFGTGYSNLSYLKRFHIDNLKIDQSFICNATTDANDAAIVKAIIAIAKGLDINLIAEGVETKEQLSFLIQHQCNVAQGYYFGRPVPRDLFESFMVKTSQLIPKK